MDARVEEKAELASLAVQLGAELAAERVRLTAGARLLVVRPAVPAEAALAVRLAAGAGVATSVGAEAGGEAPEANGGRGRLHLDLSLLCALVRLDESSLLVHAQAGARIDALATRLAASGISLGALPPGSLTRTVGALLAAPRPSEATPRGRFLDLCAALEAVLPDGTPIRTRLAPRKATGPDFCHALLGARGRTGVITAAWLRAERRPPRRAFASWSFSDGAQALAAARRLLDRGARPADLALVDGGPGLGAEGPFAEATGTILAVHLDGTPELVAAEEALLGEVAAADGGRPAPAPAAETFFLRPPPLPDLPERFIPSEALAEAWARRRGPSILRGLHAAGAALLGETAIALPPPSPSIEAVRAALARSLDPRGVLAHAAHAGGPR